MLVYDGTKTDILRSMEQDTIADEMLSAVDGVDALVKTYTGNAVR